MKSIIHWNKQKKTWTHHTYKGCEWSPRILIHGSWQTELKPERPSNPRGWVTCEDSSVTLNPSHDILSNFSKRERLIYDKQKVSFNVRQGDYLLFDQEGCYILEPKKEEVLQ